jgi:N-acetylneuraminate lyase
VNLSGILPAVVTPIDQNERFAADPFERLIERLYAAGADGVYVSGHTGEGLAQPLAERELVIETAVRNSPPGKLVIAHVGAHRTADALRLARHAANSGAHAVSSLPPIGSYSLEEVKSYYAALAAATDLPVLVYYFPEYSRAIGTLEALRELLAIPNVAGLKFTGFDLYSLSRLKLDGAVVFNGHDEVLAAGLLMGADGGIGSFYNLVPELFVEVYRQARAGDWRAARAAQDRINELIEITLRLPYLAAIKRMLEWSGIACGPCFAPRRRLSQAEEARLAEWLAASSFAGSPFAHPPG